MKGDLQAMKYGMKKKIGYSIIILAMLVGFTLIAIFGVDSNGSGSAKDINLGLDLAGINEQNILMKCHDG